MFTVKQSKFLAISHISESSATISLQQHQVLEESRFQQERCEKQNLAENIKFLTISKQNVVWRCHSSHSPIKPRTKLEKGLILNIFNYQDVRHNFPFELLFHIKIQLEYLKYVLTYHAYETKMINYNVSVLYISVLFVMAFLFRNKDIDDFIMPVKTVSLYLIVLFSLDFILSYYRVL